LGALHGSREFGAAVYGGERSARGPGQGSTRLRRPAAAQSEGSGERQQPANFGNCEVPQGNAGGSRSGAEASTRSRRKERTLRSGVGGRRVGPRARGWPAGQSGRGEG